MKKRLLLMLITLFICGVNLIHSQIRKGYIEGPDEIQQFNAAVFTCHFDPNDHNPIATIIPWHLEIIDKKEFMDSDGMCVWQYTFLCTYDYVGDYDSTVSFTVKGVEKNFIMRKIHLAIDIPNHICPYGTQLSLPKVDSRISKTITITGNNTAKITDAGLLTYDPETGGQIDLMYKLNVGMKSEIHKKIQLLPHYNNLMGAYNIKMNGSTQRRSLSQTSSNPVNNGQAVEITFQQNLYNFSWEFLSETGAFQMSYNPNSRLFRFIPSYQVGSGFRFRFYYNEDPNCTHLNYCDFGFTVRNPYSVAYVASSNVVSICRDDDSTVQNRMLTNDTYRIVNALTGVSQKPGQLAKGTNEIDVSNILNGIYIVQITSGDNTESYKISINR
nr:MAG TPA: hypothetical protein [Caudoviricetes sp.]